MKTKKELIENYCKFIKHVAPESSIDLFLSTYVSEQTVFSDDIDTIGHCANCGVEFHIHKEQQSPDVSAEEISKAGAILQTHIGFGNDLDGFYESVIAALDEYAGIVERRGCTKCAIKQSKALPEMSDSEIEKHFTSEHYDNSNGHHYRIKKDRIFGAKWYRDRNKQR
jgi:hypothetical protein